MVSSPVLQRLLPVSLSIYYNYHIGRANCLLASKHITQHKSENSSPKRIPSNPCSLHPTRSKGSSHLILNQETPRSVPFQSPVLHPRTEPCTPPPMHRTHKNPQPTNQENPSILHTHPFSTPTHPTNPFVHSEPKRKAEGWMDIFVMQ
ncbi:uncharacterized protein LY89DRAFT_266104 [Mollisia scopiformis]|uniref:Uncharacterized protein n=1 Tax=Mollisia scopiformis TaxID=149040 RepID=A0A132BE18_MOLSC|nr:uncharacterized protein LY89DRAFT_266104 [Mollisia scopiformis]KUJ09917.1 hypothetical protein LY89DRAFT_266104 [Mollisia scopiformis]